MLKEELKQFARSIGVAHLGIGSPDPFPQVEKLLHMQHEEGTYPYFAERDVSSRINPTELLPGAKSIISIAVSYLTDDDHHPMQGDTPRGLVSRYARGRDYHPILAEKLKQIVTFLSEKIGREVAHKAYVDTGPPVDRAFAARAGIGWYGKNALIYVPGGGSWVFLAQIVTDVELEPDPMITKSCGTCDKCMRACPTNAIERPYWINPHKCLSYITQMPGMIPKQFRKPMGRHLWGCDICQVVCPWNSDAEPGGNDEYKARPDLGARPDLIKLLTISTSKFKRLFGPTAMAWRGKKTIQRNACICLGNIGDPKSVEPLIDRLVNDLKYEVRGSAAWALGQIGGSRAIEALKQSLTTEKDPIVVEEIEDALGVASERLHLNE